MLRSGASNLTPIQWTRRADATWAPFFEEADFDFTGFSPVTPEAIPPMAVDAQFAWTGSPLGDSQGVVRIEAATWRGRPVWFDVNWPTGSQAARPRSVVAGAFMRAAVLSLLFLLPLFIAWRNWNLHRVDLRGALQLQAVVYVTSILLAGVLAATIMAFLVFPALESLVTDLPRAGARQSRLSGSIGAWAALAEGIGDGPMNALFFLSIVVLMRLAIRRLWAADVLAVALFNVPNYFGMGESLTLMAMMLGPSLAWIWLMRRFGFLSLLVLFTLAPMLMFLPHHLDGGWLGQRLLLFYAVPAVIAAWAVWVIVSARQQATQGSPAYVA